VAKEPQLVQAPLTLDELFPGVPVTDDERLDYELGLLDEDWRPAAASPQTSQVASDSTSALHSGDAYVDTPVETPTETDSERATESAPSEDDHLGDFSFAWDDEADSLEATRLATEATQSLEDDADEEDWGFSPLEATLEEPKKSVGDDWDDLLPESFKDFEATPLEASAKSFTDDEDSDDESFGWDESISDDEAFTPPADVFAAPPSKKRELTAETEAPAPKDEAPPSKEAKTKIKKQAEGGGLRGYLEDFFARVKADLRNEDAPPPRSVKGTSQDLPAYALPLKEEEEEEEESGTDKDQPKRKKKTRGKKGRKTPGILTTIAKPYLWLVGIVFGLLTGILKLLSKLPLIGRLFKPLLAFTRGLEMLARFLPLVLLIGVGAAIFYLSVPGDSSITLPDEGSATFSSFAFDAATLTASGVVTNTGAVIAEVQPIFTIHTLSPTWNPTTWVLPQAVLECRGEMTYIDIGAEQTLTATCGAEPTGLLPRATGVLE
jgi:hypothetical protein